MEQCYCRIFSSAFGKSLANPDIYTRHSSQKRILLQEREIMFYLVQQYYLCSISISSATLPIKLPKCNSHSVSQTRRGAHKDCCGIHSLHSQNSSSCYVAKCCKATICEGEGLLLSGEALGISHIFRFSLLVISHGVKPWVTQG